MEDKMIRTLQKRFIRSAMLAITILLFVLLGAINIGNIYVLERQNRQMLGVLLEEETMPQPPHRKDDKKDKPKGFLERPLDANSRMAAVYFTVKTDERYNIFEINTDRIADLSEEEAEAICQSVIDEGAVEGKIRNFLYGASVNGRDGSRLYLFLDTTMQLRGIWPVVLFSIVAGLACWFAMLFLVILISKRAIRPIAENMARQKQFVTDAGHEIKTPLAIILANTEAMELYEGENKWSRNIREQTMRLNGLMQNLLILARADEGQELTRREKISLSLELTEILKMFAEPVELKGLAVTARIDDGLFVKADREQLRRLFSILLDNAVKYSPPKGKVTISLEHHGKTLIFSICNQCEKLPECSPEKLFDRFYRADAARTQENGGYGIGLSAAKTIALLCRGMIRAAYCPPDRIAFTVELPGFREHCLGCSGT